MNRLATGLLSVAIVGSLSGCASPSGPAASSAQAKSSHRQSESARLRSAPAVSSGRWSTIGESIEGRPIQAWTVGSGPSRVYLIGSIHGNETQGLSGLPALMNSLGSTSGATLRLVRDMNPDGTASRSRGNARGVDLNRNWPAANFRSGGTRGESPLSEPETRTVYDDLAAFGPEVVIVLHSTPSGPFANYDGPASRLAEAFANAARDHDARWHVRESMGYPTPGSLGTLIGVDRGVPILTIEFDRPYDVEMASAVLVDGVAAVLGELRPARQTARTRSAAVPR